MRQPPPTAAAAHALDDMLVREMLQTRLLHAIFRRSADRQLLVLKGGLALRTALHSSRMTKDIDLDANPAAHTTLAQIQKTLCDSINEVLAFGLIENAVITEPKQTDATARWKINGNLPGGGSHIHLTVEISRRGSIPQGHITEKEFSPPAEYNIAPFKVVRLDDQALAAAKTLALVSHNRVAPRDLFDLAFLIRSEVTPPIDILAQQSTEELQRLIDELWPRIEQMDWDRFRIEVLEYIAPADRAKITEKDYENMRLQVGDTVTDWLDQAMEKSTSRSKGVKYKP